MIKFANNPEFMDLLALANFKLSLEHTQPEHKFDKFMNKFVFILDNQGGND